MPRRRTASEDDEVARLGDQGGGSGSLYEDAGSHRDQRMQSSNLRHREPVRGAPHHHGAAADNGLTDFGGTERLGTSSEFQDPGGHQSNMPTFPAAVGPSDGVGQRRPYRPPRAGRVTMNHDSEPNGGTKRRIAFADDDDENEADNCAADDGAHLPKTGEGARHQERPAHRNAQILPVSRPSQRHRASAPLGGPVNYQSYGRHKS